ncbi:MAG TPA: A24 family peptidase [Caulobacteraceae bacterium]|jgi:leader peptidase (prepilin peptidase)/N-methyltransferase|nr:A24 family peptidase [Caulobacteraceae bacterium]
MLGEASVVLPLAALGAAAGGLAWWVSGLFEAERRRLPLVTIVLATSVTFGWAAALVPFGWLLGASLVLAWTLGALAAVDAVALRLPDVLTLPLIAGGLMVSLALPDRPIAGHLAGAVAGYAVLAALAWAWRRWRGIDGIGLGDAKLLAAAGAWLGWRPLPEVVMIACALALAWVAFVAIARRTSPRGARIAFGAPLSLAIWIVWLYGPA